MTNTGKNNKMVHYSCFLHLQEQPVNVKNVENVTILLEQEKLKFFKFKKAVLVFRRQCVAFR